MGLCNIVRSADLQIAYCTTKIITVCQKLGHPYIKGRLDSLGEGGGLGSS